jgi:diguanylate cyclase (GGDEF)-like protein
MIELRRKRDVAFFCSFVTGFSVFSSFGSTIILGSYFQIPISPIGYNISWLIPLIIAGPVSYLIGSALRRVTVIKEQMERLATVDPLTNVFNRKGLFDRLALMDRDEGRQPLSLIMLDIDHFKAVNDTFGHMAGDIALREVANLLLHVQEDEALVGRLGGEEFLIAMFGTLTQAAALSEQLRRRVASTPVVVGSASISISASFGVTSWHADEPIDAALQRADKAMYDAKATGRNRVVISATQQQHPLPERSRSLVRTTVRGEAGQALDGRDRPARLLRS